MEELTVVEITEKPWMETHEDHLTFGQGIADWIAKWMGSWTFIIGQTVLVGVWIILNLLVVVNHWDPYPFILLNLLFSTQAAYAAPIIMMSQNRQTERDRIQATADYYTNVKAKEEIEELQLHLQSIEDKKLDKIISLLENKNEKSKGRKTKGN